jgi:S1-C subfamily serine protease
MAIPVTMTGRMAGLISGFMLLAFVAMPTVGGGAVAAPAEGTKPSAESVLDGVVRIATKAPPSARSADTLGTEREGSGIVIDSNGLVLTIGYLLLEVEAIEIGLSDGRKVEASLVAYDHDTGFGLLRAAGKLPVKPVELGDSDAIKVQDQVLVAAHGGQGMAMPALVVSRRVFTGYWEYLLENAIFTSPPHPAFGGAALFASDGKLVGVGSLIVGDAAGPEQQMPGNMFVPIDRLKPILAELLDSGRSPEPPRPWLGLNSEEVYGRLFVTRVAPGGPAEAAGIAKGDLVVGIGGQAVSGLAEFYRKVWALGPAGVSVPLDVLRGTSVSSIPVKSGNRYQYLKMNRSY